VGLAALYRNAEHAINHGPACLLPNDHIEWLILGNTFVGRNRASRTEARRTIVRITSARLRYGMPVIDFRQTADGTRHCFFGRHMPVQADGDRREAQMWPRELAVLERVNAAMTRSCTNSDAITSRVRPARGSCGSAAPRHCSLAHGDWFPRAYLGFDRDDFDRLLKTARHKPLSDLPVLCRIGFTTALAKRLPLVATADCVYRGPIWRRDGLVEHRFRAVDSGAINSVILPKNASVRVADNAELEAGQIWAHGLPALPPTDWISAHPINRWTQRRVACGGNDSAGTLLNAWFFSQILHPKGRPDLVLVPSWLIAHLAMAIRPGALFWDVSGSIGFDDCELEAMIFPPLRIRRWQKWTFCLRGEVLLDATIGDPNDARLNRCPVQVTQTSATGLPARLAG
jgi:hypothetical protein